MSLKVGIVVGKKRGHPYDVVFPHARVWYVMIEVIFSCVPIVQSCGTYADAESIKGDKRANWAGLPG